MAVNSSRALKVQAETDIAVLQVQVKNIEDKFGEIKEDLRAMHQTIENNAEETRNMLKTMRDEDMQAHDKLASKVSALEKWRWMIMGAGVVLGSMGFDTVSKLLK